MSAADHLDAPTTKANHRIDITDLYAFKSAGGTTLVLNVNPLTSPADSKTARFDSGRHLPVQHRSQPQLLRRCRLPGEVRQHAHAVQRHVVQDYTIKRSTGASARTTAGSGPRSRTARRRPTSARPSGSPTSAAVARPSPVSVTIRSSSTCRASSSSRSSSSPARPTWASSSVASPASTPSRAPTSARSPSRCPNARLGGTGHDGRHLGDRPAAIPRDLPAGRADGPPGDQHGVQQHQRGEGSGQPAATVR